MIAARLKGDPTFAEKLEKFLSDDRQGTSAFETDMENVKIRLSRIEAALSIHPPSDEQAVEMPEPLASLETWSPGEIIQTHW